MVNEPILDSSHGDIATLLCRFNPIILLIKPPTHLTLLLVYLVARFFLDQPATKYLPCQGSFDSTPQVTLTRITEEGTLTSRVCG